MNKVIITEADEQYLFDIAAKLDRDVLVNISFPTAFDVVFEGLNLKVNIYQNTADTIVFCMNSYSESLQKTEFFAQFELNNQYEKVKFIYSDYVKNNMPDYVNSVRMLVNDVVVMIFMFFHVLNNYKDYQIVTEKEVVSHKNKPSNNKKKREGTKKRNNVVRVVNKVYRISNEDVIKEEVTNIITKSKRNWYVDEFTRRGHYRTLKSGERVWVRPTIVKTGKQLGISGVKTYKL